MQDEGRGLLCFGAKQFLPGSAAAGAMLTLVVHARVQGVGRALLHDKGGYGHPHKVHEKHEKPPPPPPHPKGHYGPPPLPKKKKHKHKKPVPPPKPPKTW